MTLRLNGSTSGYTEIDAPPVAGNNNLKLPSGNGSDGNILGTDGAGNLSWVNGRMVLATAQNSTSGTSIDFTGIPSWVKRVTVMFNGVSTNGTSIPIIQIGAGSITATGYSGGSGYCSNGAASVVTAQTTGFGLTGLASAASSVTGNAVIALSSSNTWIFNVSGYQVANAAISGGGAVTLSGTLDRIRVTTVNGTDTFDAGSINILYEG